MHEWIGCGPSAASQFGGERYQRPANLNDWCLGMEFGDFPKTECVALDDDLLFTDAIVFGLRMNAGVDLDALQARFSRARNRSELEAALRRFEAEGLLESTGAHHRLTHRGRLVCDAVGSALLET
jgi:oxygen-independent coproporphyrinogen-3 oxidase